MTAVDELVARILAADRRFKQLEGQGAHVARPNPPADDAAIAALRAAVPFRLPPSYERLLRVLDGAADFKWVRGELVSCAQRAAEPHLDESADRPDLWFFVLDDGCADGVAFDLATRGADGEMEVIELAGYREDVRHASLTAFLEAYAARLEGWLA